MQTVTVRPVAIVGTGAYLPERILTNAELEKIVDTTNEWIVTRTGISERHMARDDQPTSDMGAEAARRALADAGLTADDVDLIICASITPDMTFPSTACFIQQRIGAKKAFGFDVQAACAGFLYSLETARRYIETGAVNTALVIGAEKLSCITDWKDRNTCVLFGDGAGAVVLQPAKESKGIVATVMGSDGTLNELLNMPGGGSANPASHETVDKRLHYLKMAGKEVFKHAVTRMSEAAGSALEKAGLTIDDISCIVTHQANLRIIQAISDKLGVPMEKFHNNLSKVGNTSAASIPLALDEAVKVGRIKKGDYLLFVAFGGGFTWGAAIIQWGK
jgi:3-oxoacyl-[acyl-carrier-protein] synthase-3